MTSQHHLPCVIMRGGTSRGPYFLRHDLPSDPAALETVLIAAMGAGHELQVDGIGGGHPLTSKVAIVGPSTRADADVDYLFAQVLVHEQRVDFSPNCGNMLAGVGPFAIESGLITADGDVTSLKIHNVNTGKIILAKIQTPHGRVTYAGNASIGGVPGTAAPIYLAFLDAAGSKTGHLLPTHRPRDVIDGIEVSCVDAAMPVVIMRAQDMGVRADEQPAAYHAHTEFMQRLEKIRIEAGARMGIANAADKVIPKPVLIGPAQKGGTITARYFMPHQCHTALAVTGSVAIATACMTEGTLAHECVGPLTLHHDVVIEHPSGQIAIHVDRDTDGTPIAMIVRTARRIMEGRLIIPAHMSEPVLQRKIA
jgi:2-methylaconitate cis-trans-isomerase PrpF